MLLFDLGGAAGRLIAQAAHLAVTLRRPVGL
jgi:hypothetical protein